MPPPLPAPAATALDFDDVPFRGIVEQSLAGVYVVLDERFMYANDRFAAMFGYPRDEFIGRRMVDCVTADSAAEVMRNYHRRISGEVRAIHYQTKGLRKDGAIVHLELHASRVECRGRPALAGVALDITERVLAQEALRESSAQLQALAHRLTTAQEVERARLARDVHDLLGGMLSSAKFDVSRIVRRTAAPGQEELHGIASELVELLQETIVQARSISEGLHPAAIELLGLGAALRQMMDRYAARHEIEVVTQTPGERLNLTVEVATQIYRIAQEALTNVSRHAQASRVELALAAADGRYTLSLRDDGRGLAAVPRRPGSIGLFSMAERAREIGAELRVAGHPGGGTEVTLSGPLQPPPARLEAEAPR